MVQVALLTLNERDGSTRQGIWKCIESSYPEADRKRYMVALKKLIADASTVQYGKNKQRFALEASFKAKALKRLKMGMQLPHVFSSKPMTELVKKNIKNEEKAKKAAKDKVKDKAKQNKKTAGSNESKATVADKRKKAVLKMIAKTKANSN